MVPIASSSGAYTIVIGDTFGYDMLKSTVTQTYGGVTRTGQGFYLGSDYISDGTMVSVEVTDIDEYGVSASISAGTASDYLYSPIEFDYHFEEVLAQFYGWPPKDLTMSEADFDTGLGYAALFQVFVDPVQTSWTYFTSLTEASFISTYESLTGNEGMTFTASLTEIDGIVYLDWSATGDYYYVSSYVHQDYSVTHQVKCAYKKSTGVLQGMHIKGSADGQMDTISDPATETLVPADITFSYEAHAELVGFNLPDLDDTGGGTDLTFSISGFTWAIALGTITLTAFTILVRRKNR